MAYVQGFIIAVPTEKKDAYIAHANGALPIFKDLGMTRMVEGWGDDLPEGKVTDFRKAVLAEEGETVVFSWCEYPDRATYESAKVKMMEDPRMEQLGDMPFDGKRMVYGGFDPFVDERGQGRGGYADGFVLPVPEVNREAYRKMASDAAAVFKEYGAVRVVEAWGDDVPDGKVTDFRRAVKAEDGEAVVFSFIEWPDKETRNQAWEKVMADPRMKPDHGSMPFDGQRMFWGGFQPVVDA